MSLRLIEASSALNQTDELMNDTCRLPSVLVVSATTHDADLLLRSAAVIRKQSMRGAMVVSCHWGPSRILVGAEQVHAAGSLELAGSALQLLEASGLTQSDGRSEQNVSHHRFDSTDSKRQPPMIQVSVPAHFGVELMLIAGAALRPLADRHVLFVGLCGGIDSALRDRFHTDSLETLTRFGNQLPKHRIADLYPLFFLIGASSGTARGVLDRVIIDGAIRSRDESTLPGRRPDRTRVPRGLEAPIGAYART
jgi:hypothetical protein